MHNLFNSHSLTPLSHCALDSNSHLTVSIFKGELISRRQFNQDVSSLAFHLTKQKNQQFALYFEQAYPFCVNLFALLHTDKQIWITANNKSTTAQKLIEQGCLLLGEWQGKEFSLATNNNIEFKLKPLDINKNQLILFTSGSTGQAKKIIKSLRQFQQEIGTLEHYWGHRLEQAQAVATVSHQHIYGLLFRLLWPLAAGRCFHSEMYISPESLLKAAKNHPAYWVASPAQLKRLDELSPWQEISHLVTIYSSGGTLPMDSASQIESNSGQKVLEIYGSSETGGIAWRQGLDNEYWTLFDGLKITQNKVDQSLLSSPYLADNTPYLLDDKINLLESCTFNLLGRKDRIVKVEEKRLSLDELEHHLSESQWIQQAHVVLLTGKRDKIAANLVLTETGSAYIQKQGREQLIKQLRSHLLNSFESVVLPRKWLFIRALPLNPQGKINQSLLTELLLLDSLRFPQILYCDIQDKTVRLTLRILPKLICFTGHFPEHPILPGVTQIYWVESFGKIFFKIEYPFLCMEVIKFKKIICPTDIIHIKLTWKPDSAKLYFELDSKTDSHSSGRMVYGTQS